MNRAEELYNRIRKNGEDVIDELIITRESESFFLDFKRSADDGSGTRLHQTDRKNLSKAISGFGNSEGGVIIWGIDCSDYNNQGDLPHTKYKIQNVNRFASWLEGFVSASTIPAHNEVKSESIVTEDDGSGFAITYIPKSMYPPLRALQSSNYYYIRAGSDFLPAPHAVLMGMFGKLPQPNVTYNYILEPLTYNPDTHRIELRLGLALVNIGMGIAKDIFLNLFVESTPGTNCESRFEHRQLTGWTGQFNFERQFSVISPPYYRLPPKVHISPLTLYLSLAHPFENDLLITGICGGQNSPSYNFEIQNYRSEIESTYLEYIEKYSNNNLEYRDEHKYAQLLLGINDSKNNN